jgi:hypothetical protein
MTRIFFIALAAVVVLVGGFFIFNSYIYNQEQGPTTKDYKATTFYIDGKPVTIDNTTTRYFGNELKTDLNADGIPDIAFIITQSPGGSGTFYYVVGAIQDAQNNYHGTDGYFLGDRIAPQTTEVSQNPNQKNVIVVNYADRAPGEPMTTAPSVGKSVYLKVDPQTMQWGIVAPATSKDLRGRYHTVAFVLIAVSSLSYKSVGTL